MKYSFKNVGVVTNNDDNKISFKRRMLPLQKYAEIHNINVSIFDSKESDYDVIIIAATPRDFRTAKDISKKSNAILIVDRSDYLGNIFGVTKFGQWLMILKSLAISLVRMRIHEYLILYYLIQRSSLMVLGSKRQSDYCQEAFNTSSTYLTDPINSNEYSRDVVSTHTNAKVRMIWEGTEASFLQLELILPVLRMLRKRVDFELVLFTDRFQKPESIGLYDMLDDALDVKHIVWDSSSFQAIMSSCDIGLAPIDKNNEFNRSKPYNKLLSYWAFGLPVVCDNIESYENIVGDSHGGLICSNAEDWLENLSKLVRHSDMRKSMGKAGYEYAWTYHNEMVYASLYFERIHAICKV